MSYFDRQPPLGHRLLLTYDAGLTKYLGSVMMYWIPWLSWMCPQFVWFEPKE